MLFFLCSFFFLMIRRPPRSTLFPTRRSSDLGAQQMYREGKRTSGINAAVAGPSAFVRSYILKRSEEHTSELQSPVHLVCRLLLEKKKTMPTTLHTHSLSPQAPRDISSVRCML